MGDFKKFISTKGKTFEEIKKAINDMVNGVVDTVIDDVTEFMPKDVRKDLKQKAHNLGENPEKKQSNRDITAQSINYADDEDYEASYSPRSIAYPHEPRRTETPQDELMFNKIRKMRTLDTEIRRRGAVKRAVEVTMLEQGRFMADVEDDFNKKAFCALSVPVYAAMSVSQLRTYFTWRTDARRGKYTQIDKPYVVLYCAELLNKIGIEDSAAAFERLLDVWKNCRSFASYLDAIMPRWLKDFAAFNDISAKYPDICDTLGDIIGDVPGDSGQRSDVISRLDAGDYSGKLDFLAENSKYDIKSSGFYSEQTRPLLDAACEAALNALDGYFSVRGVELSELVCGKLKKDYSWSPFMGAVVNLDTADGFKPLRIGCAERYCVKRGEPALELFEFSPARGFIGYVLKSVEAELRVRTGYNRRIVPKPEMLQSDIKNRTRIENACKEPDFLDIIPRAVDEYCLKNGIKPPDKRSSRKSEEPEIFPPRNVEIDTSKLEEIRKQSDEIARKLIVENDEGLTEQISEQISDEEFSVQIDECKEELSPPITPEEENCPAEAPNPYYDSLDIDWQEFARNLIPVQLEVLKAMLERNVKAFCRERGLLAETVFEEINTEALAAYGDVVIESGELVSDYKDIIGQIVKAANM